MVAETIAELTGFIDGANFAELVAWVRSEFDHIEVLADHAQATGGRATQRPLAGGTM